jgi:ABC-type sugar transport system substrate-binding protein
LAYPGDLPRGIPAKIPEVWTAGWLTWRKDGSRDLFPKDWKRALVRSFVSDWLAKHPKARGVHVNGAPESVFALKTRLEECRRAWAEHPANRQSVGYDPQTAAVKEVKIFGAALQAKIEALEKEIRKC